MYEINYGYKKNGAPKTAQYATLEQAKEAAQAVFAKTGIILSIVKV